MLESRGAALASIAAARASRRWFALRFLPAHSDSEGIIVRNGERCSEAAKAHIGRTPRRNARASAPDGSARHACCIPAGMFVFFSNKLGCLGSIVVSLLGTALVLGLIWLL